MPNDTTVGYVTPLGSKEGVAQRCDPVNYAYSIEDGLRARLKDALFMLGRQRQMKEFQAAGGSRPVRCEVSWFSRTLDRLVKPPADASGQETEEPFPIETPLELIAEEETPTGSVPAFRSRHWDAPRLSYRFSIKKSDTRLAANDYDGSRLDWYSFDLEQAGAITDAPRKTALKPSPVTFYGQTAPGWWNYEDGKFDPGDIRRQHLNYLTVVMMEFAFLYHNDWHLFPLVHHVGAIRRIDRFRVIDSFGVVSDANPVIDTTPSAQGWEVFTQAMADGGASDGSLLYRPNNVHHALEGEPVESVSLWRDEANNLVWAVENKYEDADGGVVNRRDEEAGRDEERPVPRRYWHVDDGVMIERASITGEDEPGRRILGPVELYEASRVPPANWIPYVPRRTGSSSPSFFRRGRTRKILTDGPQYKGILLGESTKLHQESVPRLPVRVLRLFQLARGADGRPFLWRSRKVTLDDRQKAAEFGFDNLIEAPKGDQSQTAP